MKRAWPYAVALAVVVTGCYLALAPLLRSLTPGPTGSASQVFAPPTTGTTVSQTKGSVINSPNAGSSRLVSNLQSDQAKLKAKRLAARRKAARIAAARQNANAATGNTNVTGSAGFTTGTTPTPPSTNTRSTSTKKTPTKTTPKRSSGPLGGSVPQGDNAGLAGKGDKGATVSGGVASSPGPTG